MFYYIIEQGEVVRSILPAVVDPLEALEVA